MRTQNWAPLAVLAVCIATAPTVGRAAAQTQQGGQHPSTTNTLPTNPPNLPDPGDPNTAMRAAALARAQSSDRQKRIVDDTAKLLELANELKQEVDKTNKDQMSVEVIKKADEIEKLAHDVKTRMKG